MAKQLKGNELEQARKRLTHGVDRVHGLVDDGEGATSAVIKVATDLRLPEGEIRLLAAAYNTSAAAGCRTGDSLLQKVAEYELADPDRAVQAVYPQNAKRASQLIAETFVSREYSEEPVWLDRAVDDRKQRQKQAADAFHFETPPELPSDPNIALRSWRKVAAKMQQRRDDHHQELFEIREKISQDVGSLQNYFSLPDSIPFAEISANCLAAYGKRAQPLLDKVAAFARDQIPVAGRPRPMDRTQAPYRQVDSVLSKCAAYHDKLTDLAAFEKEAAKEELTAYWAAVTPEPLPADPNLSILNQIRGEKRAFLAKAIATGVGEHMGGSILKSMSPSKDQRQDAAFGSLVDPDHERRLRAIRAQAVMHQLLSSDFFRGENPAHVADAFNAVAKIAPRLVDNPAVMEAVMRRHMAQGQADPHDLSQVLDIENQLKDRDALGDPRTLSILAPSLASRLAPAPKH